VDETASLQSTVESMQGEQCATMPVLANGRMVGLLTLENVTEMIMVNAARSSEASHHREPKSARSATAAMNALH